MVELNNAIEHPETIQELLLAYSKNDKALIWAGGTEILMNQSSRYIKLNEHIISLSHILELTQIHKTERFLEFGAMVTLENMYNLGEKLIPNVLLKILSLTGTLSIRNLATLGGSIASKNRCMDIVPVLACLDAQIELKKLQSAKWVGISHLFEEDNTRSIDSSEVITRIRIPFEAWDICLVKKNHISRRPTNNSTVFCLLAKTSRELISDLRIAMGGSFFLRNRMIESILIGHRLPLSQKDCMMFIKSWEEYIENKITMTKLQKKQFISLLKWALEDLSE